jgi:tRNA pseudouridine38-40 synthase
LRWEDNRLITFEKLNEAAALLIGEHDFSAFCVAASLKENNRCKIESSEWRTDGSLYTYDIIGNRFLHGMVRSLVGSMINLATEKPDRNNRNLTLDHFKNMLSSPEGERAVFTAPAHGLYLVSVSYEKEKK